ncbi:MAG: hypothetical protein KBC56_08965 [Flavobacterium sp.]|nr:hypothetical protein [Flavobacterium sp.]
MSLLRRIQELEFYKSLTLAQRNLCTRRQNRLVIEHGYEVAKNLGLEQFEKQTAYNHINTQIIRQLIKDDKNV